MTPRRFRPAYPTGYRVFFLHTEPFSALVGAFFGSHSNHVSVVLSQLANLEMSGKPYFGLLLANFGHLYSVLPLGLGLYWKFRAWDAVGWGNVGFVYFGAATRISFLSGLGLDHVGGRYRVDHPITNCLHNAYISLDAVRKISRGKWRFVCNSHTKASAIQ
jgi:hypothetical protein